LMVCRRTDHKELARDGVDDLFIKRRHWMLCLCVCVLCVCDWCYHLGDKTKECGVSRDRSLVMEHTVPFRPTRRKNGRMSLFFFPIVGDFCGLSPRHTAGEGGMTHLIPVR
jgi:hypothetical protein